MKYLAFFIKFIFLFLISYFVIGTIIINITGETGINKTVGWAWDLTSFIIPLSLIYFSTYSALFLMKIKTNMLFSILSILLLLFSVLFKNYITVFFLISFLIFLSNVIFSIYLKFKK
ncbi:hypothetical protein B0A58_07735 [Flavobacterium branchiophilum NBRC 15030 = ATCC 35035]|uniref:Uncharacterized protein n=1 Tax=Flavobacterium branchiophilum TaxID=55197 RepID=A0A543G366_9FLAO|nr:hypothetical protein B0A58_07735 [Flavobacterium branchiophilum NBRC 15030 = ATCC 35035]TQM40533.1 hypothetical protein BC670_1424 [Flavobacterium branchiophilum]